MFECPRHSCASCKCALVPATPYGFADSNVLAACTSCVTVYCDQCFSSKPELWEGTDPPRCARARVAVVVA